MLQENTRIAEHLEEAGRLLEEQGADPFRATAYRRAAETLRGLTVLVHEIYDRDGRPGLVDLTGIGESISRAIVEILNTGRWSQLERMRGEMAPEVLFRTLPGIGATLAEAIHSHLHVETLHGLEAAAHDGRLEQVPGIGPRKAAAIRDSIAVRLQRTPGRYRRDAQTEPPVSVLLEVDAMYLEEARADRLPRIAPKRFNPNGERWLPILHTERDGWSFTALFSNTAQAHRLGRTDDWVVISFAHDGADEGQHTIVTEYHGPQRGQRVVRGRETECARLPRRAIAS